MKKKSNKNKYWLKVQEKAKKYWDKLLEIVKKKKDRLVFKYYQQKLNLPLRVKFYSFKYIYNNKSGAIFYFLALSGLTLYIGQFLRAEELAKNAFNFFIGSASMVGGILAIVFTLNTFLMQNAAENSSAYFFNLVGRDKWQDIIYFLIACCSITLFTFALIFDSTHTFVYQALQLGLLIIGMVFFLVFALYKRVFTKIQPYKSVDLIREGAISQLNRIERSAHKLAQLQSKDPNTDKTVTKEETLALIYQQLSPITDKLNLWLGHLFDYHDKLLSKKEKNTAFYVLDTITFILKRYFAMRNNSSVILPTYYFAFTSDSGKFLTQSLERLGSVGAEYIKADDNEGIRKVVHLLKELAISAGEVTFLGRAKIENPIVGQCRGYLDQLITIAIKHSNTEGLFQAATANGEIGVMTIDRHLPLELNGAISALKKIGAVAVVKREDVVVAEVFTSYQLLVPKIAFSDYYRSERELDNLFDDINFLLKVSFTTLRNSIADDRFAQMDLVKPYQSLIQTIFELARRVDRATSQNKLRELKSNLIDCIEVFRTSLRDISDGVNISNHILANSLGQLMESICLLMLELATYPKWSDHKAELISKVEDYMHQVTWFTANAPKIDSNLHYDQLVDVVAKSGIKALDMGEDALALEAVGIIESLARQLFEKDSSGSPGHAEPDIMSLAGGIGALALKQGKLGIVNRIKSKLTQFDVDYVKKHFSDLPPGVELSSPRTNQLELDTLNIKERIRSLRSGMIGLDDAKEMMGRYITEQDIDSFVTFVWHTPVPGPETTPVAIPSIEIE